MKLIERVNEFFSKNDIPTIVGIRHQIGLCSETYWLDQTIKYLNKRIKKGDEVMLEIPEYPLTQAFRSNLFRRIFDFYDILCQNLEQKGAIIIPGEDKERWYSATDSQYHEPHETITREMKFL